MRQILALLLLAMLVFTGTYVYADTVVVVGQPAAAPAGGPEISDDFGSIADWDTSWGAGTWGITANELVHTTDNGFDEGLIHHDDTVSTTDMYVKVKFADHEVNENGLLLRVESAAGDFYQVSFYSNDQIWWSEWTGTSWQRNCQGAETLALTDDDEVGLTMCGATTNTLVKIWKNPTADMPDSCTSWDSGGEDVAMQCSSGSDHPTGTLVGLKSTTDASIAFDDFRAGAGL